MTDKNCGNCKFGLKADEDTVWCRRFPPSLMFAPVPEQNLAGDMGITFKAQGSAYPRLRVIGWCGEHQNAPPTLAIMNS